MKQNNFRLIIILGAVAIIGIIIVQIYWMQKAWSTSQKQFNQTIQIALQNVANKIFKYNNIQPPIDNPVDQLSASYFVVNTNSEIDPNILEYYLISEFNLKNINIDFEYGIYNCNNDKMVYGNYISSEGETETTHFSKNLQKHSDYIYYFGVNFPTRKKFILSNISVWIVFSTILLVVIIFFTYSLFIIMQQKRLSEQQRDFINNMTHEFKTPISSINISSDVLLNPEIIKNPDRLKTYAGLIKQENQRLNDQVGKVLNIARIERSGFTLQFEQFDAQEVIRNIIQSTDINNKNILLKSSLNAKHSNIKADKLHFTNIMFNLLDNAIKYSGDKPKILIKTENIKGKLKIIIADEGKGIDKTEHRKVFKKFYRVPTGNVHDVKGFGLGLYYVKTICKLHKWIIDLKSELNKGTEIILFLPYIEKT